MTNKCMIIQNDHVYLYNNFVIFLPMRMTIYACLLLAGKNGSCSLHIYHCKNKLTLRLDIKYMDSYVAICIFCICTMPTAYITNFHEMNIKSSI